MFESGCHGLTVWSPFSIRQFTSGNVQFWFHGMCFGGNEGAKNLHFQDVCISARTLFCEQKLLHCWCLGMPWQLGFLPPCQDSGQRARRLDASWTGGWRAILLPGECSKGLAGRWGNAETNETNHGWKGALGFGNPPVLKKVLNTQVNALTTAETFLIFSLVIVKLFGGPSSSFLVGYAKRADLRHAMCLESMLSNETMDTASINSWLFNSCMPAHYCMAIPCDSSGVPKWRARVEKIHGHDISMGTSTIPAGWKPVQQHVLPQGASGIVFPVGL